VTSDLIEGTCSVGTPDLIADKVRVWAACGIDEVAVTPAPDTAREVIDNLAELVLPLLGNA